MIVDVEKRYLGALMRHNKLDDDCYEAIDAITGEHFTPTNRQIATVILERIESGDSLDIFEITDSTDLPLSLLSDCMQSGFAAISNAKKYRDMILENSTEAKINEIAQNGLCIAQDMSMSATEKLAELETLFTNTKVAGRLKSRHIGELAKDWVDYYETLIEQPEKMIRPTGITGLDEIFDGGVNRNDLVIIGARPKQGKTTLATAIAKNIAIEQQKPVLFFSLELSGIQIFQQIAVQISHVNPASFRRGMTESEFGAHANAMQLLQRSDFLVYDDNAPTIQDIKAEARRAIRKFGGECGAIFVDQLSFVKLGTKHNRHDLNVGEISTGCKQLARELNTPVFLVAQINRGAVNRSDMRPRMSDLKDSGRIEEDADRIILVHWEKKYKPDLPESLDFTEIIVEANRHGGTGSAYVKNRGGLLEDLDTMEVERLKQESKTEKRSKRDETW